MSTLLVTVDASDSLDPAVRKSWCDWVKGLGLNPKLVRRVEIEMTLAGDQAVVTEWVAKDGVPRLVDGEPATIIHMIQLTSRDWPGALA